jgi:uncharacterized protein YegP (UPF0339 family)
MSDIYPKQFVFFKDEKNEWRWRLLAENNKIIADGAEGYTTLGNCVHGAKLVAGIATNASMWNADTSTWIQ